MLENGKTYTIECANLTETTLSNLIAIANEQKKDELVRKTAENILRRVPEKEWTKEIQAVFGFVKSAVRYTRDIDNVETVKTPRRHLQDIASSSVSFGDCDDMSLLLATLLGSAGYRVRFVIIRTQNNPINAYNHIYVEAFHPRDRNWISLDATMKDKPFGWSPAYINRKIYNVN